MLQRADRLLLLWLVAPRANELPSFQDAGRDGYLLPKHSITNKHHGAVVIELLQLLGLQARKPR